MRRTKPRWTSYFYPRSPCGERPAVRGGADGAEEISIHALLAESDPACSPAASSSAVFLSTLSLRRATPQRVRPPRLVGLFLSTLSLRRATERLPHPVPVYQDFYPRSPCGERHVSPPVSISGVGFLSTLSLRRATPHSVLSSDPFRDFYPRSPCGERLKVGRKYVTINGFLSTLSLRRATLRGERRRGHEN